MDSQYSAAIWMYGFETASVFGGLGGLILRLLQLQEAGLTNVSCCSFNKMVIVSKNSFNLIMGILKILYIWVGSSELFRCLKSVMGGQTYTPLYSKQVPWQRNFMIHYRNSAIAAQNNKQNKVSVTVKVKLLLFRKVSTISSLPVGCHCCCMDKNRCPVWF